MYDLNRKVWVKSQKIVGTISERNYIGSPRRACYIVDYRSSEDSYTTSLMTGSDDLRPADYMCDGCSEWRSGTPHASGPDGEYPNAMHFCFLCAGPPAEREAEKLEMEYYKGMGEI